MDRNPSLRLVRTTGSDESGFSVIELLVVMSITALLATLGAMALRGYLNTQALQGGEEEVIAQLRRAQEQAVTESHPIIFGVQFNINGSEWSMVRFDPVTGDCEIDQARSFTNGVVVSAAEFADSAGVTEECEDQLPPVSTAADEFVFFYPRGTATAGTITLSQPKNGDTETLSVMPITGRVEED